MDTFLETEADVCDYGWFLVAWVSDVSDRGWGVKVMDRTLMTDAPTWAQQYRTVADPSFVPIPHTRSSS